jgi:multicomponent K+:H+ antiporter subunit D
MSGWTAHLAVVPILLPLCAGAVLVLFDERKPTLKAVISLAATVAVLGVAIALLHLTEPASGTAASTVTVYRLGDWPAPFSIVLVVDRLAAFMLVLTGILALTTFVFSLARWHGAGSHFHSLFQFLIMGLNGAFLTGDLFNLFVFFEVLLAASYGLVLHGSGRARLRGGLHYIAINLAASALFLIGVSLIYGVIGTLNIADIAVRLPAIAGGDRALFEAGAAILCVAFLVKAGMWPLNFWLPGAYAPAAAPVAAFFAIVTKVGVYIILRLSLLMFGADAGASARFGDLWLTTGGMLTIAFGAIGILTAPNLRRLAGYSVLISSGTLLAMIGVDDVAVTGGALFYLASSVLAISALFMLIELAERGRPAQLDLRGDADLDTDEEEDEEDEVGVAIPATMAILGLSFVACTLLLAGLPPLSGFIAKFVLLKALLAQPDAGATSWVLMALLLLSGFAAMVAMARAGIRSFWLPLEGGVPRVRVIEIAPIIVLLALCGALTVQSGSVMRFLGATAADLHVPGSYIRAVLAPDTHPAPEAEGS